MELSVPEGVALAIHCFTFLLGLPANLLVLAVYVRKARKHGATPNVRLNLPFSPPPASVTLPAMEMLLLSVYIFTFLTGVPANILAFSTLLRKACRKAAPVDVLLLNLTGSDLLLLAFLPLKMKEAQDGMLWRLPYALCPLTGFLFYVSIYTSTLLLAAVSVERYLAVAFPLRWSVCRRPRYAAWACAAFWLLTSANLSIVYILPYIQWRHGAGGGPNASACAGAAMPPPPTCYLHFTKEELSILLPVRLELFLVLFCVPFAVSCFCYTNFVLILSRLPRLSRRRRLRGIGLAVGTLLVFALCFGPYNASHVVGYVTRESQPWRDVALLSSTLNTCLDPFIFYFSSAAVREALSCCLRGAAAKLHLLFRWRQAPPRMRTETRKYEAGAPPFVLEPRRPEEEQHAGQRAALDGVTIREAREAAPSGKAQAGGNAGSDRIPAGSSQRLNVLSCKTAAGLRSESASRHDGFGPTRRPRGPEPGQPEAPQSGFLLVSRSGKGPKRPSGAQKQQQLSVLLARLGPIRRLKTVKRTPDVGPGLPASYCTDELVQQTGAVLESSADLRAAHLEQLQLGAAYLEQLQTEAKHLEQLQTEAKHLEQLQTEAKHLKQHIWSNSRQRLNICGSSRHRLNIWSNSRQRQHIWSSSRQRQKHLVQHIWSSSRQRQKHLVQHIWSSSRQRQNIWSSSRQRQKHLVQHIWSSSRQRQNIWSSTSGAAPARG
ncbi:unnamed protein product [Menidia menidia]|uniref:(Atlantic silverside) hypothetical protein n=1 Tax=Menidia menidia TaxID=238744 RepID=A0A8S4BK76_9TELE|nr:unnamed protein product [Menidia menidia]